MILKPIYVVNSRVNLFLLIQPDRAPMPRPELQLRHDQTGLTQPPRRPRLELTHDSLRRLRRTHHNVHVVRPNIQRKQRPSAKLTVSANSAVDAATHRLREQQRLVPQIGALLLLKCSVGRHPRMSDEVALPVHRAALIPVKPCAGNGPRDEVGERRGHRNSLTSVLSKL